MNGNIPSNGHKIFLAKKKKKRMMKISLEATWGRRSLVVSFTFFALILLHLKK